MNETNKEYVDQLFSGGFMKLSPTEKLEEFYNKLKNTKGEKAEYTRRLIIQELRIRKIKIIWK